MDPRVNTWQPTDSSRQCRSFFRAGGEDMCSFTCCCSVWQRVWYGQLVGCGREGKIPKSFLVQYLPATVGGCLRAPSIYFITQVKYGVRSPKFILAPPVHSCTHWLIPRNSPPPPAFGFKYEGAIGQPTQGANIIKPTHIFWSCDTISFKVTGHEIAF